MLTFACVYQACFELVYGGVTPTITKTIRTSPKTTTRSTTLTITPATSTSTPYATATETTTLPPVNAIFLAVGRAGPCDAATLDAARQAGDQSTPYVASERK